MQLNDSKRFEDIARCAIVPSSRPAVQPSACTADRLEKRSYRAGEPARCPCISERRILIKSLVTASSLEGAMMSLELLTENWHVRAGVFAWSRFPAIRRKSVLV